MDENVPKLLPVWQDVSLQELQRKSYQKSANTRKTIDFDPHLFPDHGGAGIDVTLKDDQVECLQMKSGNNVVNFGSASCAIPLLPPNKIESLSDPCLGKLIKRRKRQSEFCKKLQTTKNVMKQFTSVRHAVLKAHSDALHCTEETDPTPKVYVPKCVDEIARQYPKRFPTPKARWSYLGGCLAVNCNDVNSPVLIHPTGSQLNNLALTPLIQEFCDSEVTIVPPGQPNRLDLGGGQIFQIVSNSGFDACCIRQKRKYHYLSLKRNEASRINSCALETYNIGEELSYIEISNYIPGEHVVVTKSGLLLLQNAESKKLIWKTKVSLVHDSVVADHWWSCNFGSHPRSLFFSDSQRFSSLDLRTKWRPNDVFSVPNPFLMNSEELLVSKKVDGHDFQHLLSTNYHLFIFDERYPQQPVLSWKHMLESYPLYCDIKTYGRNFENAEHVVLLGCQESQDVASFHLQTAKSQLNPLSLSHPLHVSKMCDCISMLKHHCVSVENDVETRLTSPLVGLCSLPLSKVVGYAAIHANSHGDVFHQVFTKCSNAEKSYSFGPGCEMLPPGKISSAMSKWIHDAKMDIEIRDDLAMQRNWYGTIEKSELLDALFSDSQNKSENCSICNTQTRSLGADNSVCSNCGLTINYGKRLIDLSESLGVLAGDVSRPGGDEVESDTLPNFVDFSNVTDPLSSRMLDEWVGIGQQSNENIGSQIISSNMLEVSFGDATQPSQDAFQPYYTSTQAPQNDGDFPTFSQDIFPSQKRKKLSQVRYSSGF